MSCTTFVGKSEIALHVSCVYIAYKYEKKWLQYTGWPRKNATTLIVNFMNIVDKTELLFFILFGRTFIFLQNDTMIISFG